MPKIRYRAIEPPPNPAKTTDARFQGYMAEFGVDESWELDALEPTVLADLIRTAVMGVRDEAKWAAQQEREDEHRELLTKASTRWDEVVDMLNGGGGDE